MVFGLGHFFLSVGLLSSQRYQAIDMRPYGAATKPTLIRVLMHSKIGQKLFGNTNLSTVVYMDFAGKASYCLMEQTHGLRNLNSSRSLNFSSSS